jgi:hypothetical protein
MLAAQQSIAHPPASDTSEDPLLTWALGATQISDNTEAQHERRARDERQQPPESHAWEAVRVSNDASAQGESHASRASQVHHESIPANEPEAPKGVKDLINLFGR